MGLRYNVIILLSIGLLGHCCLFLSWTGMCKLAFSASQCGIGVVASMSELCGSFNTQPQQLVPLSPEKKGHQPCWASQEQMRQELLALS